MNVDETGELNPVTLEATVTPGALAPHELLEKARGYAADAKAPRTRQEYRRAWDAFVSWCERQGRSPLPALPDTVALYLTARAQAHTVATIEQDLSAISAAHRVAGLDTPRSAAVVREVRSGIRRRLGVAPKVKAPLLAEELKKVVQALPRTLAGIRDRALLLLGFAAALRRGELVALEVRDLEWTEEGLKLTVRRSKTDQEGAGRPIGVPFGKEACPVKALKAWLEAAGITEGPVFREVTRHGRVGESALSGRSVARIVQRAAKGVGLEPSSYAGHSLRAGLATSAAREGKSERSIMNQTGHKSTAMVRRYIRDAELFRENAAEGLL
jgi:integrase